jgi:hypothetical protein
MPFSATLQHEVPVGQWGSQFLVLTALVAMIRWGSLGDVIVILLFLWGLWQFWIPRSATPLKPTLDPYHGLAVDDVSPWVPPPSYHQRSVSAPTLPTALPMASLLPIQCTALPKSLSTPTQLNLEKAKEWDPPMDLPPSDPTGTSKALCHELHRMRAHLRSLVAHGSSIWWIARFAVDAVLDPGYSRRARYIVWDMLTPSLPQVHLLVAPPTLARQIETLHALMDGLGQLTREFALVELVEVVYAPQPTTVAEAIVLFRLYPCSVHQRLRAQPCTAREAHQIACFLIIYAVSLSDVGIELGHGFGLGRINDVMCREMACVQNGGRASL